MELRQPQQFNCLSTQTPSGLITCQRLPESRLYPTELRKKVNRVVPQPAVDLSGFSPPHNHLQGPTEKLTPSERLLSSERKLRPGKCFADIRGQNGPAAGRLWCDSRK